MPIPDKALWVIERNSAQPLSLDDIAAACGVSRSHLAQAFGTATGLSVMQYLRARRLSDAARALADGAPDILSVALDAGYGSHEAFTRAFRDRFQQTPESVRDRRTLDGLALVCPLELRPQTAVCVDPPRFVDEPPMRVVGLAEICSFDTAVTIPAQWQRFMARYDAIPEKLDRIPIGINQPADDDGRFEYVCGSRCAASAINRVSSSAWRFRRASTRYSSTAGTCQRSTRPIARSGTSRCRPAAAPWPTRRRSSGTTRPSTHARGKAA